MTAGFVQIIKSKSPSVRIFIWGAWSNGFSLESYLSSEGIFVDGYIDSDAEKIALYPDKIIYLPQEFFQKYDAHKTVVLVSLVEHSSVRKMLEREGFQEYNSYMYLGTNIGLISAHNFCDTYGNIVEGTFENVDVSLGMMSRLHIGENVQFGKNVRIIANRFSEIVIGGVLVWMIMFP
jgi:hypothetical protein